MKKLIGSDIGNYIFDKDSRTIIFTEIYSISLSNILLITNVTTNTIIYNFASISFGGSLLNNILTLDFDTTLMSNTDILQIFIDIDDISEYENFELMHRLIMLSSSNASVNKDGLKIMIAEAVPTYPITSDGIGVGIIRSDLIQTPNIEIGSYPIYYPDPTFDDPENINNNYIIGNGSLFPLNDLYLQTSIKHLTVSKGPVDQRWEMIIDSQTEYSVAIRDKLIW